MKLLFGLLGALLVIAFLGTIIWKVPEVPLIIVALISVVMAVVDLWHARNEPDV